jgi:electron transfer flavoprotein alpha subunit
VLSHHKTGNYTHVLTPSTAFGKNFLPRLGALLDLQPISDVQKVVDDHTFARPIYAGSAIETVKSSDPVKLMTVRYVLELIIN